MSRGRKRWLAVAGLAVVLTVGYWLLAREDSDRAAAMREDSRRNFPVASVHWAKYLEGHPDDDEARIHASRCARLAGDFETAVRIIRRANRSNASGLEQRLIDAQHGNLELLESLLRHHIDSSDAGQAAIVMEAVALGVLRNLNPNPAAGTIIPPSSRPIQSMGMEAASRWLELRHSPADQAAGFTWRARLHDLVADYPAAMADFRRALDADPGSYEARLHYAFSSHVESAPVESLDHLNRLQAERPDDALVRLGLASVNRRLGRLQEADRLFRDLLKLEPDNAGFLVECANIAIDLERPDEAESMLERARNVAPDRADVWFALSRCMMLAGRTEKANEYRNRYLELDAKSKSP